MEAPPSPGVSNLTSINSHALRPLGMDLPPPGVSAGGIGKEGSQSHLPPHLRESAVTTDRDYAIANFPSIPIAGGDGITGYVIQFPLNKKAVASSRVANGDLPDDVKQKYAHLYKNEDKKPVKVAEVSAPFADSLEIPDDDEPLVKEAFKTEQIGQLPPYDAAGNRQMTKKVQQPMGFGTQAAKSVPGTVQDRGDKNMYDTIQKTKVPWEYFKKASWVNDKVEKFAQHFGMNPTTFSSPYVWTDPDTDALTLDLIMAGNFGKDWVTWEPETLWEMLSRIGGSNLPQILRDKLQALKTMHSGDYFWEDEGIFEKICLALNGIEPDFEDRQYLNVSQIAKAVTISSKIKSAMFSDEVAAHVAAKAHQEGFIALPTVLAFAQPALSSLQKGLEGITAQVQRAYAAKTVPTAADDFLNVQLRKLYAVENYVALP